MFDQFLKAIPEEFFETFADGFDGNTFDDFSGKGMCEQAPCAGFVDTTAPAIEDGLTVQLANGCAVRALYVVGEDFQLGLGVHGRAVSEDDRSTALFRIGLLSVFADEDLPVEDTPRTVAQHAMIMLVAVAVRHRVIGECVVIDNLLAADDVEAVQRALDSLAIHDEVDVVSRNA